MDTEQTGAGQRVMIGFTLTRLYRSARDGVTTFDWETTSGLLPIFDTKECREKLAIASRLAADHSEKQAESMESWGNQAQVEILSISPVNEAGSR